MVVGEYRIGSDKNHFSISLDKKPNLFHRWMFKIFFGIQWIDYSEPREKGKVNSVRTLEVPQSMRR